MDNENAVSPQQNLKQPKQLYGLGLVFSFERFAYYGGKPMLVLFLTYTIAKGGLGITPTEATVIAANLGAFTYLAPLFGGIIADKYLGSRYCIMIGCFLMSLGWLLGFFATSAAWINALIIVVSLGTGFFKGNLNALVGDLYEKDDPRKDMGFSILYSFVNGGAFFGSAIMAAIFSIFLATKDASGNVVTYAFRQCYLLAAIMAFLCGILFIFVCRYLGDLGKKPNVLNNPSLGKVDKEKAKAPLTKLERNRVVVILLLTFFSVFFWVFYNQSEASVLLYADKYTNFHVGGFLVPSIWTTTSANGLLCTFLSPVFAAMWMKLSKKRKKGDLTMTQKIALGYIFLGFGYVAMLLCELSRGGDTGANRCILWILSFTIFQTVGELCFSPLGTSVVSKTSPPKYLSLLMGVWFMATFVSQKAAGYVEPLIAKLGILQVFIIIPAFLFIGALILLALNNKITKLTEDEPEQEAESV